MQKSHNIYNTGWMYCDLLLLTSKIQRNYFLFTPTWDICLSLKKKYPIKPMLFSITMRKMELPHESIFFVSFGSCEKIEVKRGHLVKKWEFGQTKKILLYQFFKTRICAFMTYGQFPPKSTSNLRSVIQDSRVRGFRAVASKHPEPLNLKWQISNFSYF